MKKIFLTLIAAVAISATASAQSERNAIGLRLTYGVEVSYQRVVHSGSADNRIEADLGFFDNGFVAAGIYQWKWDIGGAPGLSWYTGPGLTLGVWGKSFNIGAAGQIGLEYAFNIPLSLSLDWRPGVYFINNGGFSWEGFGLGVRYRF